MAGIVALALAAAAAAPPPPAGTETLDAPPKIRSRVWLGVFIENAVDGGIQVVDVVPGGPAARAGLERGDVVIRAGDSDLATMADLRKIIEGMAPGDALTLAALRDGNPRSLRVVLGAPPPPGWALPRTPASVPEAPVPPVPLLDAGAPSGTLAWGSLGLAVERIPEPLQEHLGGRAGAGVLVARVDPGGPAAGLVRAGDLVVEAAGRPRDGPDALEGVLARAPGERLRLACVRDRKSFAAVVPLRAASPGDATRSERIRILESSIHELEATLEAMRKELADLKSKR